jgi:hypothetical protein
LMAIQVHGTPRHDMNHFIKECAHFFHDRWSRGHLFLSFWIQIFKQRVNIAFQCALASITKKHIALACDVCSRPSITIKSHNLHAGDTKRAMGEIASYHEKD